VRFSFAFFGVSERYGDLSTTGVPNCAGLHCGTSANRARFAMRQMIGAWLTFAVFSLIFAVSAWTTPNANGHLQQSSLETQCENSSFLSISARTRTRETAPHVELLLRDSSGRVQGQGVRIGEIPMSRYAEIVQLPRDPQKSRALAIEVCNAEVGLYEIEIKEKGTEPYVLDVTASGEGQNIQSMFLHHIARNGVTRRYRFVFRRDNASAILRWLDENGEERMKIENYDW